MEKPGDLETLQRFREFADAATVAADHLKSQTVTRELPAKVAAVSRGNRPVVNESMSDA